MFTHHAQLVVGLYGDVFETLSGMLGQQGIEMRGNPNIHSVHYDVLGVDDARRLSELQLRTSIDGGKKVFIIGWRQATAEAQNALLKVFEEPTLRTYFFIITEQEQLLLPTLRSRLTKLNLHKNVVVDTKQAKAFLQAGATERLEQVQDIISEKDKGKALALLTAIELVCTEVGMVQGDAGESLLRARRNLATRSPSLKLIFEHLALTIPRA